MKIVLKLAIVTFLILTSFAKNVNAATGDNMRISVSSVGVEGNGDSKNSFITPDGRYIVFDSEASNLVSGDTNNKQDAFLRDMMTGITTLVSVGPGGVQGNGDSNGPTVSSDGRYVAFSSFASNLVGGDTNFAEDVFVHDLLTHTTIRVSVASTGDQGFFWDSYSPYISANGRYVVFESKAPNLVVNDTNNTNDIFVHDNQTGETIRASVNSIEVEGNQDSHNPTISADGRYAAFSSWATNLVDNDTNDEYDVFLRDLQNGSTRRISLSSNGVQGNYTSYAPSISSDGRYITFESFANNLTVDDTDYVSDIFLHDIQTGNTSLISVSSNGVKGNDSSSIPFISPDGRFIAFESYAKNLVDSDTNNAYDIFLHDVKFGTTTRVSLDTNGAQVDIVSGNLFVSLYPSVSSDGRYVAFQSIAVNIVNGDTNNKTDIFVHEVGMPPLFSDVPNTYWAWQYIEQLYNAGVTSGCATSPILMYCPDSTVTRAQMAVFLLKGMHGSSYTPPAVGVSTGFTDVAIDYWAAAWIKQLAAEGITGGCGAGVYCPDATVTRAQMAIFLLRAKHGSSYSPPTATGVFTDVPVGYWADKWIEQLALEGITGGCGTGVYCPDSSVTRAQMAVFLVKTFALP